MTMRLAILLTLLIPIAWAGDEFLMPSLREGSGYESSAPKYRVVGIEDRGDAHTLFVVAEPPDVLTQKTVNRIIKDIQLRNLGITEVSFYASVRDQPRCPADNKTYFGVAAKKLYGGWAHGPQ
jgi:hypothetical protein